MTHNYATEQIRLAISKANNFIYPRALVQASITCQRKDLYLATGLSCQLVINLLLLIVLNVTQPVLPCTLPSMLLQMNLVYLS